MLAWLHQGVYGTMTQIATYYRISRPFLYQLLLAATLQLAVLFRDEKILFQKGWCSKSGDDGLLRLTLKQRLVGFRA
jgi:hypothetical protein